MTDDEIIDIVVVGEDGRITIPYRIREELKLTKGSRVIWTLGQGRACVKKI